MLKNIFLLALSIIIYAYLGPQNFVLISFSIASTYIAGRCFKYKYKRLILISVISVNAAILTAIRFIPANSDFGMWASFWISLGISYYTLQVISYLVDVYREKYEAEKNLFNYIFYNEYIPHLFIGPISKYDEFKAQLTAKRKITLNNLYAGSLRIAWGLLKMLVIARRVSIVIGTLSENTDAYSGAYALLAMFLYSILLYADFSGGIDIVLGVSKIFGINLIENFDGPYYSENIKEFWRRWHISLGRWIRDYIYIPLGGSRHGKLRKSISVLIAFFVSGIWHGVSYILWGIFHGIFVLLGDKYNTRFKWLNRLITFVIVSFLWSFFIWQDDTMLAVRMAGTVFTNFNIVDVGQNILNLGLTLPDWIVLGIFTAILFIFDGSKAKFIDKIKNMQPWLKAALICIVALLIVVFGIYGFGFDAADFIYGNF